MTAMTSQPSTAEKVTTQVEPIASASEALPSAERDVEPADASSQCPRDDRTVPPPGDVPPAAPSPDTDMEAPTGPQAVSEMRSTVRHPFRYAQTFGTVHANLLPSISEFQEALCDDLSAGGVAMFLNHRPESDTCVIALGKAPRVTYYLARVTHVEQAFRVGYQFLRRLELDPTTGDLPRLPLCDEPSKASWPTNEEQIPS